MQGEGIPDNVRALIAADVRSVLELESLLLLHASPQSWWTAADLGRELRVSEQGAARELADLASRGFAQASAAEPPIRYAYAAAGALHDAVEALATVYAQRRVSVIEMIYSRPTDPVRSFADAFNLRNKERPHG